jgi:putative (di)nucleoside polyphosphate hydrolase
MPREVSCGVIVRRRSGELLLAHATGRNYWDIPKGVRDPGETSLDAALRELREEAGLSLDADTVRDLGAHVYLPRKDLHLFVVDPPLPELSTDLCRCTTFYRARNGRDVPEVDTYRWAGRDEVPYFTGKNMARVLMSLDW